MTEQDNIKELFAKGLQDHQVPVDPAIWSAVSASIGATAAKTGLGLFAKTLIGVAATAIVAGTVYLSLETKSQKVEKQVVQKTQETIKSKEDKKITPTAPAKTTYQTFYYDPPAIGCFDIKDDDLFIPDFDAQTYSGNSTEVQALTSAIVPQATSVVIPAQGQLIQPIATPSQNNPVQEAQATAAPAQNPRITPLTNTPKIKLPNVFTPNNDGQNDWLEIDWKGLAVSDFSLVVLNQNNQVVYRSSEPNFNWNGTDLGGEKLAPGFFIYFVTSQINGEKWQQSSSLQIQY
ncbi:MAG: hypothetical protein RLZZ357_1904 [Bacteroidota bacterium]|jgi:hypothetical protein